MKSSRPALATALIAAAITVAGCAAGNTNTTQTASTTPSVSPSGPANAPALEQAYVSVVAKVLPSVVQITSDRSLGSGIVFDTKGDIVTNAHVVGQASKFQVRLADNPKALPATLVGAYPPDDLAVIKLDAPPSSLHPAHLGDSSKLQAGDIVLAMGNPLGLTGSVTDGIISFTGRTVTEPAQGSSPPATLPDIIQTSAAINPGNSGGALVDLAGDVVGVPTLAAIDPQLGGSSGGASAAPGIGFAIPSNVVAYIAGQLNAHHGHVVNSHRAALGLGVVTVVDPTGAPIGVGVGTLTPAGPAATAGIRVGEVITAVNNTAVRSATRLATVLAELAPGQAVPVALTDQQGATRTVTVTLGQLPGS